MYVTPLSSDASERRNSSVPKGSSEVFFEARFNVRGAAYWTSITSPPVGKNSSLHCFEATVSGGLPGPILHAAAYDYVSSV